MNTLKKIYALCLFILPVAALHAQKLVGMNEIQYDPQKKLHCLRSTNEPYTGRAYSMSYYASKDTSQLQGFTNGKMDYNKMFSNGKPYYLQYYYNNGFRQDSICYEYYLIDQYASDTTTYEVHWIDKNKVKRGRVYMYYYRQRSDFSKPKNVSAVSNYRFFHKSETKDFTEYNYKTDTYYDTAGYHNQKEASGYTATYYSNRKMQSEGWYCIYENKLKNKGRYDSYNSHCGTWKYYDNDGVLTRIEDYSASEHTPIVTYYYPNGKVKSKANYNKKGSELKLPPTLGITINPYDEYIVASSSWHANGLIASESVRSPKGDIITYVYSEQGKPMRVQAFTSQNKPFGIHKTWNEQGQVTEYMNYSVERVDTLCYKAVNGKIQHLNLRDRNTPLGWEQMPVDYYGTPSRTYLYNKATVYKTFHPNGKLKTHAQLKTGQLDGKYMEYDSTGVQIAQYTYKLDVPDGAWTEWYPNGRVKKSYTYKNGLREGNCTEYYPSGNVRWENIYTKGVSGQPKAYSENGTLLSARTYLDAFYPANCIELQAKGIRTAALHYYFLDTTWSMHMVTVPDSAVDGYARKVIAMRNATTPGYDMCDAKPDAAAARSSYDIYHSCFALSKSLYTEENLQKIKAFFARHGLTMDKTEPSANPVLGLEKEFLVYYSGKQMLNKQLIVDSVEVYLAPRAIDAKQGYVISMDNNFPQGTITTDGSKATITSNAGYSTIVVESGIHYPSYPQYDTFSSTTYIVYDDLSCDVQKAVYGQSKMLYWAGK